MKTTVNLSRGLLRLLEEFAEKEKLYRNEVVRRALNEFIAYLYYLSEPLVMYGNNAEPVVVTLNISKSLKKRIDSLLSLGIYKTMNELIRSAIVFYILKRMLGAEFIGSQPVEDEGSDMESPDSGSRNDVEFYDVPLSASSISEIIVYPTSRTVKVLTKDGEAIVFRKRALSQLLRFADLKIMDVADRSRIDIVRESILKVLSEKMVVVRALRMDDGALYAVRVTSPEYTPVPHRVLFDYISEVTGLQLSEVIKYRVRTVGLFKIYEIPLSYARPGDALEVYLAVSNANTGRHSIKIYGYFKILACSNGLATTKLTHVVRITHKMSLTDILARVGEGVRKVIEELKTIAQNYKVRIEQLEKIKVDDEALDRFIEKLSQRISKKYRPLLEKAYRENRKIFGNTLLTAFQTVTYLIPRIRSEDLAKKLSSLAEEILVKQRI